VPFTSLAINFSSIISIIASPVIAASAKKIFPLNFFSPRVWSGKPYASKQIVIAPPIEIKKVWGFEIKKVRNGMLVSYQGFVNGHWADIETMGIIKNDGLSYRDFCDWFKMDLAKKETHFTGQIICWNENINY